MADRKPQPGDMLTDENGDDSLVVGEGWSVLDALVEIVEQTSGWDGPIEELLTNPVLIAEAGQRKIQVWHCCTAAWCEAEGIDTEDLGVAGWWAPNGDGKRTVRVLSLDESGFNLGERAAEAARKAEVEVG